MGTDFLIGIRTDKFVLLGSDMTNFLHGAITVKSDQDKSYRLGEKTVMLCFGEGGDANQFSEYISKNLQLYKMRNGYEVGPQAAAHYTRKTIAESLRSRDAYLVFLLIGGYDDAEKKAVLYGMDYLGTKLENPFLTRGFAGRFCWSILDRIYRPDWTEAEAIEGFKQCMREAKKRFALNLPHYQVQIINKDGVRKLETIVA